MMSETKSRIAVVDDDERMRDLLSRYLSEQGFQVQTAEDGPALGRLLARERFDLLVLDLMMPGEDGLAICRRLRGSGDSTPIIMLTAKGDEVDRIVGLEMGADDYLPKPFNPRELLARISAVLRRRPPPPPPGAPETEEVTVSFGPFSFDMAARRLSKDGENLPLTSGEYSLLRVLVTHPREPLSREKLMDLARGRSHEAFDRSIDIQISRLRRRLGDDSGAPRYIQTVWGFGYVFVPDGSRTERPET